MKIDEVFFRAAEEILLTIFKMAIMQATTVAELNGGLPKHRRKIPSGIKREADGVASETFASYRKDCGDAEVWSVVGKLKQIVLRLRRQNWNEEADLMELLGTAKAELIQSQWAINQRNGLAAAFGSGIHYAAGLERVENLQTKLIRFWLQAGWIRVV